MRPLTAASIATASDLAMQGAQPLRHNAFKVELGKRAVARALSKAGALA